MQGQANHFGRYAPERIQYGVDRYVNESRRLYGVLDKHLATSTSGYIVGDRCTIADIAHWGWIASAGWAGIDIGNSISHRSPVSSGIETALTRCDHHRGIPSCEGLGGTHACATGCREGPPCSLAPYRQGALEEPETSRGAGGEGTGVGSGVYEGGRGEKEVKAEHFEFYRFPRMGIEKPIQLLKSDKASPPDELNSHVRKHQYISIFPNPRWQIAARRLNCPPPPPP
jgi:hypothetical protein